MNGDKDASRKDAKGAKYKLQIRNSKQKGKTQNTNFKTFKNVGEVLIGRFWVLRIEISKLFRISIFGFRIFPPIVLDFDCWI